MFDTYLVAHADDPRARRRFAAAAIAALAASAFVVGSAATASKLAIARVAAPRIDHVLVMPIDVPPPPGAAPPPAPRQSAATQSDDDTVDERRDDDLAPLDEAPVHAPAGRGNPTSGATDGRGTSPIPGTGACLVPGCVAGPAAPAARVPTAADPRLTTHAPIDAVREHAIFSPDPPKPELARTAAALAHQDGSVTVGFCVDADGRVDDARLEVGSGDADVDRICRKTVERWRFRAMLVDGVPRRTCTKVTFEIAFE